MCWLLAVCALLLLQLWWLPGDPGAPTDSFSNTVGGKRGLFLTLEQLSRADLLPSVTRETQKLIPDSPCTLLLLGPERYPDEHEQERLYQFVTNGGSLVFAARWHEPTFVMSSLGIDVQAEEFREQSISPSGSTPAASPGSPPAAEDAPADGLKADALSAEANDEAPSIGADSATQLAEVDEEATADRKERNENARRVLQEIESPSDDLATPPLASKDDRDREPQVSTVTIDSRLVDDPVEWRTTASLNTRFRSDVLVSTTSGEKQVASWPVGDGLVVVSSSPDIFSNRSMLDPGRAELAVRLIETAVRHQEQKSWLRQPDAPIVLNEYLNSSQSYRGTGILMSPSLRSGTLQLMTVALLAGWFGFHRFGPPVRDQSGQRRSLTESATAVGNLQYRNGSGQEALSTYLDYLRTQLRQMFGASMTLTNVRMISLRTGLHEDEVRRRIADAEAGLKDRLNPSRAAILIRDLSDLLSRLHGRHVREPNR